METPSSRRARALSVTPGQPAPGTADATAPACPACAQGNSAHTSPPLDLASMAPPADLEEARIEDLSIDGICGVY